MKKEKTSLEKAFSLFLADNPMRPIASQNPFNYKGYVYATNGYVLIRAKEKNVDFYVNPENKTLRADEVFPQCNMSNTLTFGDSFFDKYKTVDEFEECNTCCGTGQVEWEFDGYTKDDDCPMCDGSGTNDDIKGKTFDKYNIKLNEAHVDIHNFYKLIEVQSLIGGEIKLISLKEANEAVSFEVGVCEILMMPKIHDALYDKVIDLSNQINN